MTDPVRFAAGSRATTPAGRPGRPPEIPIPFSAFAMAETLAPIDMLAAVVDGAPSPAADAAPGHPAGDGSARVAPADVVALPRRVIVAIGPAVPGDAEPLVTRLCRLLSRRHAERTQWLEQHAPALDLAHWASVDAFRAALVGNLDLVICSHDVPDQPGHRLLTVDVAERHADRVIRTIGELAGHRVDAVLTDQGWARPPRRPSDSGKRAQDVVRAAVERQALREAGRALVFPGQPLLRRDLPVAAVLALTAVHEVRSVHGDFDPSATLRCHGYARPHYTGGKLVLPVGHDDPGLVVAVEVRYSPPCCDGEH
jgi:hypothetical protein